MVTRIAHIVQFALATILPLVLAHESIGVQPFTLAGFHDQVVNVGPRPDASITVLCFLGTECPLAKLYGPRLSAMAKQFGPSVRFIGINSNRQDSMQEWQKFAQLHDLQFEMGKDYRNVIADRFKAQRTPEVIVLDEDFQTRYQGRIDNQYEPGIKRSSATESELSDAIESLLVGQSPSITQTKPAGCIIGRVREVVTSADITFCDQISRVLQRNCVECHQAGDIGPFALTDYEEVVGWAEMILEVIDAGRMPPWHANPEHGEFSNARLMTRQDKQLLRDWVKSGMPYGAADKLPEPLPMHRGWRLPRTPDQVVAMSQRPFVVPPQGTVDYQYFVVDPQFDEDKWVTAAEVIPGNRSVVHHSIVFVRPPDGAPFKGMGLVGTYVPGQGMFASPPGAAILVPAKSKFVFQQHYTPNGTEQSDTTKIGLTFADPASVTHEIYSLAGVDQEFEIPPHADHHTVRSALRHWPADAMMLSITPHMHLRGKSFRLLASASESTEVLLDVPRYDFNWQHRYLLTTPLPLNEVDRLDFETVFDNSSDNPVNPNPSEHVTWGDQTWQEMAVVFCEISVPRKPITESQRVANVSRDAPPSPEQLAKIRSEADRIMNAFDKNGDQLVSEGETPNAFRRFSFRQIDADDDGTLTRQEIEDAAKWRVR